jgi:hypothetical protein
MICFVLDSGTECDIEDALMNLDEKKRLGTDGIPPSILRMIFLGVKAPLFFIFDPSLAYGIFLKVRSTVNCLM